MKIIDNPILGIGVLLCVGLAVLALSLMTTAEGQNRFYAMVTSDDAAFLPNWSSQTRQVSATHTVDDFDESPFVEHPAVRTTIVERDLARAAQSRAEQARAQQAREQAEAHFRLRDAAQAAGSMRVTTPVQAARPGNETPGSDDPFAAPFVSVQTERRGGVWNDGSVPQHQQQRVVVGAVPEFQQQHVFVREASANPAAKRDALLFRIVKQRLERGEYESLAPVVLQMHNPETAIEAMLDFAEKSDAENISQLLDTATAVTLQLGQPRPPVMPQPGMTMPGMPTPNMPMPGMPPSGAMPGVSFGMGMPGTMPGGIPMGAMPPGAMGGGMGGGMPGMPPVPPGQPAPQPGQGGGIFPNIMPPGVTGIHSGQVILWDQNMAHPDPRSSGMGRGMEMPPGMSPSQPTPPQQEQHR